MSFLNGDQTNTSAADPHYTYTTYRQPVYQKERTTDWFTPRMIFRVAYITFLLFQMYTCDRNGSSDDLFRINQPIPVTIEYNKTAQEILDSFARVGRIKDSIASVGSNSNGEVKQIIIR